MKKILGILGTITLIGTSTTSLVACDKPTNESEKDNKNKYWIPQQPPNESNWKLVMVDKLSYEPDNKWYIGIVKKKKSDNFSIIKFKFTNKSIWDNTGVPYHIINGVWYYFKSYYCWSGLNEPETPEITPITGEIKNWNEKKEIK